MAATYWFRNTGNSNWLLASNWSLSDGGGADGAIPTAADTAMFSNLSGNCLVNSSATCLHLNFTGGTGYTGTFSFSSSTLTIASGGSITMSPTMTVNTSSTGVTALTNCSLNFNGNYWDGVFRIGTGTITLQSNINLQKIDTSAVAVTVTFSGNYDINVKNWVLGYLGQIWSISGRLYCNFLQSLSSTAASKNTIKSSSAGVQRQIGIMSCDCQFVDFTDIDASLGNIVRTYKGTISNCKNIVLLTPPTQKGSITLN